MADLSRDLWINATGTGQQVAQLHHRYIMMMKLMVSSFGIIGFLLAINCIALWIVVPCNLVDYRSVVGEYVA